MKRQIRKAVSSIMAFVMCLSLALTAGQAAVWAEEANTQFTLYYYDEAGDAGGIFMDIWEWEEIACADGTSYTNVTVEIPDTESWSKSLAALKTEKGYTNLYSVVIDIKSAEEASNGFDLYAGNPATEKVYSCSGDDYSKLLSGDSSIYVIKGGTLYTSLEDAGITPNETGTEPDDTETEPDDSETESEDEQESYTVSITADETSVEAGGKVSLTAAVRKGDTEITDLTEAGLDLWWWVDTWNEHTDGLSDADFSNYDDNSGKSLTADATLNSAGTYYVIAELKKGNDSLYKACITLTAAESDSVLQDAEVNVAKVVNLSEDFIMGMDISSVISEFDSGVTFKDYDGNTIENVEDFCKFLADNGITTIRVRVWNDPYDEDGNGYGGGNNDVAKAKLIADACREAGLKMLVDFHCSDFWADPSKQQAPKEWEDYSLQEKEDAVAEFIGESLEEIDAQKDTVSMVQVGNETTGGFAGESGVQNMCTLFEAGAQAVKEYNNDAKVVIHITNPESGNLTAWAENLKQNNVTYDIIATSYYPFWHGTLDNLKSEMETVQSKYGKDVMVAETSYAYTLDDFDGHTNTVCVGNNDTNMDYPFTVQGQTTAIRNVIAAVSEAGGLGVFYWEPAWITVGDVSALEGDAYTEQVEKNRELWEKNGSGWAASYAKDYDPDDAGKWYGGSAVDNQAMFYSDGTPVASLHVWDYVKTGAISKYTSVEGIEDVGEVIEYGASYELPVTIRVSYNNGDVQESVTWNTEDVAKVDTSVAGTYEIDGTVTLSKEVDDGEYKGAAALPVKYTLTVNEKSYLTNGGFESGYDNWTLDGTGHSATSTDVRTGGNAFHFYGAEDFAFTASQKVMLAAGKYKLGAYIEGLHAGENDVYGISVEIGEEKISKEVNRLNGWNVWIHLETDEFVVTSDDTEATVIIYVSAAAAAWGTYDDLSLVKISDYTEEGDDTEGGNTPGGSEDGDEGNTPGGSEDGDEGNTPGGSEDGDEGNTPGGSEDGDEGNTPGGSEDGDEGNTPGGSEDGDEGNTPGGSETPGDNGSTEDPVVTAPKVEIGKVTLSKTSYTYDGKAKKPAVTVYDKNGKKIAASEYTVTYSSNKNIGTAKVTVVLKSTKAKMEKTFKILPKKPAISKKTAKKKGFKITWKKISGAGGYEVQYSTKASFSKKKTVTKKVSSKKKALTVSKLKASKKYYVRIRVYKKVGKTTYYSAWSAVKKVKTKK